MLDVELININLEKLISDLNRELADAQKIECVHERAARLIEVSRAIRNASTALRILNQKKRAALKDSQEKIAASRELMRESRETLKNDAAYSLAA